MSTDRAGGRRARRRGARRAHWYTQLCRFWSTHVNVRNKEKLLGGMSPDDVARMKRNIYFANLRLEPWECMLGAYMTFISVLLAMLPYMFAMLSYFRSTFHGYADPMLILVVAIFPAVLLPLIVLLLLVRYPASYAQRLRIRSFTSQVDIINYLSMSVRLKPSLEEAVRFAADNVDEPMATGLQRVLWDVHTRKYETIERSLAAFGEEWGEFNENFKRSIFVIISAQLESTVEGRQHALQRANDLIIQGNRQILEEHRAKLGGPTMVMFAICIFLPMIVSTILPMTTMLNVPIKAIHVAALFDFIIPLIAFVYSWQILAKRPEAVRPPYVAPMTSRNATMVIVAFSVLAGIGTYFLVRVLGGLTDYSQSMNGIAIPFGVGIPLVVFCIMTTTREKAIRTRVLSMEEKLPDALFQIGSRIVEGTPLELAMQKTGEALPNEAVGKELKEISYRLQISKKQAEDVLFGPDGYLTDHPSALLRTTMGIVVRSTTKDAVTAGKILIEVSSYVRDLKKAENDIRISMTEQVSSMQNTAIIFAPVSLGISTALYVLMLNTFGGMKTGVGGSAGIMGSFDVSKAIPLGSFAAIIGLYLVLSLIVIVFFSTGILYGDDNLERKHTIGRALPLALIIFTASFMMGNSLVS